MFQFLVWPMKAGGETEWGAADIATNQKFASRETIIARLVEPEGRSLGGAPSTSHLETGVVRRQHGR